MWRGTLRKQRKWSTKKRKKKQPNWRESKKRKPSITRKIRRTSARKMLRKIRSLIKNRIDCLRRRKTNQK